MGKSYGVQIMAHSQNYVAEHFLNLFFIYTDLNLPPPEETLGDNIQPMEEEEQMHETARQKLDLQQKRLSHGAISG
jgi:hypothetical protein